MAIMIPELGPHETESPGELTVYAILKRQLSDEYVVIHSLPWLCAAVRNIDNRFAPTGEIDFLIIHQNIGVLALEVKSGHYRIDGAIFVRKGQETKKDPILQVRRNVHGLATWLGADLNLRIRIGYGVIFPDSQFGDAMSPPMLADITVEPAQRIIVDRKQMPNLGARIKEMLAYWNFAGGTHALGEEKMKRLVETLCPKYDGTPSWGMRLHYDNQVWLRLTNEQSNVLSKASVAHRMVITGWPGTGKTLIGSELASREAKQNRKVLFVTFNTLLRETLQDQLSVHGENCVVFTWHGLCSEARKELKLPSDTSEKWFTHGCLADLVKAIAIGALDSYDLLILDEAQAFRSEWIHALLNWFAQKQIVAFCDESQVFSFEEERITLGELCQAMEVVPFNLTVVLRMPKATTERLLECRPTNYQLYSPRPLDLEALQERITDNLIEALTSTLNELHQHGVEGDEIVVLTRLPRDYLSNQVIEIFFNEGVRHETVARFRGVERPAVIILGAQDMDDVQLFCAYSRATSICVALYDAQEFAWKQSGAFKLALLKNPQILSHTQEAKRRSQVATHMAGRMKTAISYIHTIQIVWCANWGTWLVELSEPGDPAETWIDYLITAYQSPVFQWYSNSRDEILLILPVSGLDEDVNTRLFRSKKCGKCNQYAPCEQRSENCIFCDGIFARSSGISLEIDYEELRLFDVSVRRFASGEIDERVLAALPIQLIAVGARLYGKQNQKRNTAEGIELPMGRNMLYRIAMAIILARVASMKTGATFDRTVLTEKLYNNYKALQQVPFKEWAKWLSQAISTCTQHKKLLRKVRKNVYSPLDPEQLSESKVL